MAGIYSDCSTREIILTIPPSFYIVRILFVQYAAGKCLDTADGTVSLSGCLSHLSIAATACGGFAAVGPTDRRYRSTAARPALTSKCEQCHVVS